MKMIIIKITRDGKVTKVVDCVGVSSDGSRRANLMSYAGVMQQVKMEDEQYDALVSKYEANDGSVTTIDIANGKATVAAEAMSHGIEDETEVS